jgi:ABC-2 type transport system ATP-binding protein
MKNQPAIRVEHVYKSYGNFQAVQDVSFEVFPGEIFAMLGPNGAGKSTILRMILDIIRADQGQITILGQAINDTVKDRIGYLPEERGLYRNVRVIDMMVYLGTLKGLSGGDARKHSMALLERLDLAEHAKKKVSELSKGMQQKVQFAVTVLHDPAIIIVDEPFSGLDPINTLVIEDLIKEKRGQGAAIIMSTHQMYQVEQMCDRLLMINRGKQALYGDVNEVRRRYAIHAVNVQGEGNWSALPGVKRATPSKNGKEGILLELEDQTTPNDLLASIAASPNTNIERFELAVPSLNDIFIRVAGGERSYE